MSDLSIENVGIPPQIDEEDLPRWYGLSFRKGEKKSPPSVIVSIREKCAEALVPILRDCWMVEAYREEFGLFYEPDLSRGFGFDEAMTLDGNSNDYLHLALRLDGKRNLRAMCLSCSLLFASMRWAPNIRLGCDPNSLQLLSVEMRLLDQDDGYAFASAPMGGEIAPSLKQWMARKHKDEKTHRHIVHAMLSAYASLHPGERLRGFGLYGFESYFWQDGRFTLQCPGNACDIGAYPDMNHERDKGLQFSCHNLDTPLQQLTLFAGLSALHDLAAKDLG